MRRQNNKIGEKELIFRFKVPYPFKEKCSFRVCHPKSSALKDCDQSLFVFQVYAKAYLCRIRSIYGSVWWTTGRSHRHRCSYGHTCGSHCPGSHKVPRVATRLCANHGIFDEKRTIGSSGHSLSREIVHMSTQYKLLEFLFDFLAIHV